jgi:hypothetical protein
MKRLSSFLLCVAVPLTTPQEIDTLSTPAEEALKLQPMTPSESLREVRKRTTEVLQHRQRRAAISRVKTDDRSQHAPRPSFQVSDTATWLLVLHGPLLVCRLLLRPLVLGDALALDRAVIGRLLLNRLVFVR